VYNFALGFKSYTILKIKIKSRNCNPVCWAVEKCLVWVVETILRNSKGCVVGKLRRYSLI